MILFLDRYLTITIFVIAVLLTTSALGNTVLVDFIPDAERRHFLGCVEGLGAVSSQVRSTGSRGSLKLVVNERHIRIVFLWGDVHLGEYLLAKVAIGLEDVRGVRIVAGVLGLQVYLKLFTVLYFGNMIYLH